MTAAPNSYSPSETRYTSMQYNRTGRSGVLLPFLSLGLWHNFGENNQQETCRDILLAAFDRGITHFDLANNYGPPPGAAEQVFGRIFKADLQAHRDELFISTKAGYDMSSGPYGNWGSRKHMISSLDQSLNRMGLDYVDLYYSHRPDPATPIEETMGALDTIVRQGKALYVGLSNYNPEQTRQAVQALKQMGTPCLIHQARYSLFDRHVEQGLLETLHTLGVGLITFSPLAQGLLTNRYLKGIPDDSRIAKDGRYLKAGNITPEVLEKVKKLNQIAEQRGQTLAQMSLAWLLRNPVVTSVLIGASSVAQLHDNLHSIENTSFTDQELLLIDDITR